MTTYWNINTGFNSDFYQNERTKKLKKSLKVDVEAGMHFSISLPIIPKGWNLPVAHWTISGDLAKELLKIDPKDYTAFLDEYLGTGWRDEVDGVIMSEVREDED